MILRINESDISAVLLADGWHEVEPGTAMVIMAEFYWTPDGDEELSAHALEREDDGAGRSFLSLTFAEVLDTEEADWDGRFTTVPLTSVLAVRHTSEVDPVQEQEE